MDWMILVGLGLYLAIVMGAAWVYRTRDDEAGFAIGGRQVGVFSTLGSLIGGFRDGGGIAIWVFTGASIAFGHYWLAVGVVMAFLFLARVAPAIRTLADEGQFITQTDFVAHLFGPWTARLHTVISLMFAFFLAAAQVFVSGQVIGLALGISPTIGMLLVSAFVAVYLMLGGYRSLILTDVLQTVIMAVIVCVPFILFTVPPAPVVWDSFMAQAASTSLAMIVLVFFALIALPDAWQRIFSVKTPAVGRTAFALAAPTFVIVTFGLSVFGYHFGREMVDLTSLNLFEKLFLESGLHPFILAAAAVAILSITMSTLDTMTYLFTSNVAKNILQIDPAQEHQRYVTTVRVAIFVFLGGLTLLASQIEDVIRYILDSYTVVTVTAPLLFYGLWLRPQLTVRQEQVIAAALAFFCLLYLMMLMSGLFVTLWHNMIPMALFTVFLMGQHYYWRWK